MTGRHTARTYPGIRRGTFVSVFIVAPLLTVALFVLDSRADAHAPAVRCAHEDTIPKSGACWWHADQRGNGRGTSFVTFSNGHRMYLR